MNTQRIWMVVLSLCILGPLAAQEPMPTRSFQRIGTTKLRHGSRILCLAYSPDGTTLAAGGGNDPVRVWNPKTGELLRDIHEPWVHALTFSSSGETLLFGGYQKVIKLWNFRLNKEVGRLEGHKATIKAIAIAPDASLIASASQDGAIYLWDMNNKRKVGELPGHSDEVNALVYFANADKNFIVSAGSDRTIIVWDTEKFQQRFKIDAGCAVHALAISPDGKTLYSAGDDHFIRRWDLEQRKQTGTFNGHDGIVVSLFLNGDTLVSGALDRTIRYWDANSTKPRRVIERSYGDSDAMAMPKAGDFVATAGLNNTIRIYDTRTHQEVFPTSGARAGLVGMALSRDNKRLAAVTFDNQVLVWDAPSGKLVKQWATEQTGDLVLAFSPDNKTLATAGTTVRLWNADTGATTGQFETKPNEPIVSLAFSPDGQAIALGLYNSTVEVMNIKDVKSFGAFKYPGSLQALAWSPDGKKIAAAGTQKIFLYDAKSLASVQSFDVKEGPPAPTPIVSTLAFGPDSKTLAAGGWDATIRIFNLHAKNPTDPKEVKLCEGHHSAVFAIAFSKDGRSLVSGSFDKSVRLWEAFSGKSIAELKGHLGEVRGVAFVSNGRSVFSASSDGNVLQWDVPGLSNNGKLPDITLGPGELENAWTILSTEETARGHDMMWRCVASAKQAVPYLTDEKRLYLLDPERVKKLFKDLDSGHYPTRTAAQNELTNYGRWMEGRYDAAIAGASSLEYKRRVEALKDKLAAGTSPSLVQERLRVRRIMLMLEQAATPEAIAALTKLAARGPEEELREEAKMTLERLKK